MIGCWNLPSIVAIDLTRDYTYDDIFTSQYDTESSSLFAQVSSAIRDNLALTSGLRIERWQSDYSDSMQIMVITVKLFRWKTAPELSTTADNLVYLSLTRGYKAGGFNSSAELPSEADRHFDTEFQWNYQLGGKFYSPDGNMSNRITAFILIAKTSN